MAGKVHADQPDTLEADVAIASGVFERKPAIRDIFRWADERARAAVGNSDAVRAQVNKHSRELETCHVNAKAKVEKRPNYSSTTNTVLSR